MKVESSQGYNAQICLDGKNLRGSRMRASKAVSAKHLCRQGSAGFDARRDGRKIKRDHGYIGDIKLPGFNRRGDDCRCHRLPESHR